MRKLLRFTYGLVIGSTVGVAASILFAPASGEDMRMKARKRYQEVLDESARAAAARRAELEAELQQMSSRPASDSDED